MMFNMNQGQMGYAPMNMGGMQARPQMPMGQPQTPMQQPQMPMGQGMVMRPPMGQGMAPAQPQVTAGQGIVPQNRTAALIQQLRAR